MTFLIDGYNLLYAMGVLSGRVGPHGLQKARNRLLGLLRASYGAQSSAVTVVFDAAGAPPGAAAQLDVDGLQVLYAVGRSEADDLIEELIARHSTPRKLAVVSDDHRIQRAARRRHCVVLGCDEYLDGLERRRKPLPPRPDSATAKPERVSREEAEHWLREFADLIGDDDLKKLSFFDFETETNP